MVIKRVMFVNKMILLRLAAIRFKALPLFPSGNLSCIYSHWALDNLANRNPLFYIEHNSTELSKDNILIL